ncbi:hypothetical protein [Corynebacterium anserum]|uniref:Uncharacterized protein n=1 Tax=Corynebacterium anserum TaxID=2684406 RepID=A0A7G7YM37_9CORY|nr:hypothetical protein [Corynebacterium anserum]MBC2681263.1 hypothetical protein [Corynebacterium anserum]QNH95557.1 hypothetical protein GP473_01560 [Corynebacterium anserum]
MTPQMEDHIVKSQKSIAARGALALVAAGSAMALTACGAGQISQTANQVPAVNGTSGAVKNVTVRDASVVIAKDGEAYLKFTASNVEDNAASVKLESIKVDGKNVDLNGLSEIKPGGSIVTDTPDLVKEIQRGGTNLKNEYGSPKLASSEGFFPGGSKDAVFTFDKGKITIPVSIVKEQPKSGDTFRDKDQSIINQKQFEKDASEGAHH